MGELEIFAKGLGASKAIILFQNVRLLSLFLLLYYHSLNPHSLSQPGHGPAGLQHRYRTLRGRVSDQGGGVREDHRPEFAILGRSNVGKSSVINALVRKKEVALTSKKLGKTQLINHFLLQAKRVANRKFPPGIKFRPTDLELIQFYLYFKIKNNCVPWWNQITEVELYNHSPEFLAEQFPQYGNNVWYFFTSRERKYPNGSRPKRTTNSGYWKATGVDKEIRENGILKGLKKTLVFYKGEPQHGDKTKWIMHEYRLVDAPIPTKRSPNDMKLDDCVLCKIYSTNNRKSSEQDEDHPEVVSDINPTTQLPQVLNTEIISSGLSLQGREAIMNDLCKLEEEQLKEQNPPGFRFDPTDRELVKYYLKPRVLNKPLPELSFMEVDLYNQNPDTLAEQNIDYGEKIWYFFTPRNRKYQNGSRPNRAAGDGYWKANGADVQIKEKGVIIGFKKTLSFMRGKPPKGEKTGWIMHEYKINAPTPTKRSENDMRLDDCVLCRIYNKKERIRNEDEDHSKDASSISLPEDDRRELMENFNGAGQDYENLSNNNTLMVSDITTQVVPDINHTTHSSPSVVDHPDEEKLEEKKFQLEEADELDLHGLLNDFDGGAEKEYHSFEHEEPPPGFRFSPTDFDLVMHYLIRKVLNHPLPWNRIVDVQLYDHSPEWLAEEYKQYGQKKWYFFTPRERKYRNGKHPSRAAGDGYWKATGTDTAIKFKELVVGYKKKLVFHRGKAPKGDKTNWIMNEYRINHPPVTKTSETDMRLDKWVLCMIYQKNESKSSKSHTQKAYPTSSHANDRNEPTKNVDMKIVEVLDFINHSYQNVPAFAHMHRVPSMEFNDEQSKPSYQVPATTAQVVSNISTSTTTQLPQPLNASTSNVISSSSPVVIDLDPDGEEDNCGISLKNQDPPPGFCPSDLELLTLYLKRKVLNQQLPSNKIVEVEVLYDHSPEWLTGQHPQSSENEWYFFTSLEGKNLKKSKGICQNQSTNDGFWEAFGGELQIQENGIVVGFKKELHFYKGNPPKGVPTNWVMDEYRLEGLPQTKRSENGMTWDEYVLCRIYKKNYENLSRICNNPVVRPKFPPYDVQGMHRPTKLQVKRANDRTQMVEPIPAMPSSPNKSSRDANATQAVGYYGGPPQMVEPTPRIYKRSAENLSRIRINPVIPELPQLHFDPIYVAKHLLLFEKYLQAHRAKNRTQVVEPIPATPSFPKSSRYANAIQEVGSYRSPPQMFEPIPSMLSAIKEVGYYGGPPQMVEPTPSMLSLPNELSGHGNDSQAVGNYGNPPQMVEPIPGMPYFPSESSGHANYSQVVGNYGNPPQMVEPTPSMLSLPNESSGHANYSQAVGNYGNPPQMVEPIPGMPYFPSESSGHANYSQVVGNYGNPPQMVEPTPSMLSLPNESSGHANYSQAVGNYGNPPQMV
nr:nac transcription factor 32 [Quercus suber]